MCFSLQSSIIAYTLGMASAIFALSTRQIVLGCLIMAYAQMQLSEAMIWYGIDNNDEKWNRRGTKYGQYLLPTHNIAIGIGIIMSVLFVAKKKLSPKDFLPIFLGIMFFIAIVFGVYAPRKFPDLTFPRDGVCDKKCQNPGNRLKWPYPDSWYTWSFVLSIALMFVWVAPKESRLLMLAMFGISWVVTMLIYPNTTGSVWCWSASFIAPTIVLINYYLTRNIPSNQLLT